MGGGAFPMITLKKDLALTGSEPGATLKMYDYDSFGNAVTVVEMDGEIDLDNMVAQLKEIEDNMEGLRGDAQAEVQPWVAERHRYAADGHRHEGAGDLREAEHAGRLSLSVRAPPELLLPGCPKPRAALWLHRTTTSLCCGAPPFLCLCIGPLFHV